MKDIGQEVEISLDLWILFHLFQSRGDEVMMKAVLYSLDYQNKSGEEVDWVISKWHASYPNRKFDSTYEKLLNDKFKPIFSKERNCSFLGKNITISVEVERKKETQHLEKIFSDTSCFVLNFNYLDKILKEAISDNLSLLSEKSKFIIKFTGYSERPDIHIFLETLNEKENEVEVSPFLGIEIVEVYSPRYKDGGSVMKDVYNRIENGEWEKIERNSSRMVRVESNKELIKHIGGDLTFKIFIKGTRTRELMEETKDKVEKKLQKEYFQNPEFKLMALWVMLLPQFYYLDPTYNLPPRREIKEKIVESFLRERLLEELKDLGELMKNTKFLLFNYLETWKPRIEPNGISGYRMRKSDYAFETNFLIHGSNFLLERQSKSLLEEPRISYPRLFYTLPKGFSWNNFKS